MTLLELIDIFIGKAKVEKMSNDLKLKYGLLESAMSMVLQISRFFLSEGLSYIFWDSIWLVDVLFICFLIAVGKKSCGTTGEVLS